jgi:hypothetical protein
MKRHFSFVLFAAAFLAVLLSACGGAAQATGSSGTSAGSGKPLASPVEFTGVIEAMDGNQWVINGQALTVDPSVLRDGPFQVGDTVKVEAEVQADGSVVVTRVEPPVSGADANANTNDDNSNTSLDNANTNANTNDSVGGGIGDNSNDDNSNNDDSLGNSNDDNSNDDNGNDDDDSSGNGNGDDDDDEGDDDDDDSGDD